jgi:hypothetical protein
MLSLPLFARWRRIWDAAMVAEARHIDLLAGARNNGRSSPPVVTAAVLRRVTSEQCKLLLRGELSAGTAVHALGELWPLVRAAVWPRWLLLEAALNDASESGGLHLAALALRTQIEELDALLPLGRLDAMLQSGAIDEATIREGIDVLRARVLPQTLPKMEAELLLPANETRSSPRSEHLQRAFDALGDYVHPNYGSHVLSVRPHSVEAARILVEAFAAVYESFLSLPWAQEKDPDTAGGSAVPALDGRPVFERLAEVTPAFIRASGRDDGVGQEELEAVFRNRARTDATLDAEAEQVATSPQILEAGAIAALRATGAGGDAWPSPLGTAGDRMRYAALVQDEQRLVGDAARALAQRGAGQHDAETWLALLCSALTFSINMAEFKLTTLGRDAARLLVEKNAIGAALSIRAMLEHHAVVIELGKKLQALWTRMEKVAPRDDRVGASLGDAEKQISRVLAATPESKEISADWRRLWEGTVRRYHVLEPVKAFDEDHPGFLKIYSLLSHVIHGTIFTGGDLLEPGGADVVSQMFPRFLIFLSRVCDVDATMDRLAPSAWIAHRLDALRTDTQPSLGSRVENSRILDGQKLKPKRDVFGSGTEDDPFRFRRGLVYHEAYGRFLRQEAIAVQARQVHMFASGVGDEVHTEDGRKIYFLNDTLPSFGSDGTAAP